MSEERVYGVFTDKDGNNITIDETSQEVQKYLEENPGTTLEVAIGSVIEDLKKAEAEQSSSANEDTSEEESSEEEE